VRIRFTPRALAELDGVLGYVAARSPQGAQRVGDRVRAALAALAEHPGMGERTSNPRLRRLVLRPYPYLLFYEAGDAEVVVIGLRHAARDPRTMPGAGGAGDDGSGEGGTDREGGLP
jgi:plasmid stabilization system protein ParE